MQCTENETVIALIDLSVTRHQCDDEFFMPSSWQVTAWWLVRRTIMEIGS